MPMPFSPPAGSMTEPAEIDTLLSTWNGCQFMSATRRIVWAANFGVAAVISVSQPDDCRLTSWLSTVASVTS